MRVLLLAALILVPANAKDAKAFSLFSVVTFRNEDCRSQSATMMSGNRNGTCYTSTECNDKGGSASGSCAMGFGTCCLFLSNDCGDTVSQNVTYVQNENFPTALTGTALSACTYTIKKCQDDICRVRLDFEQFTILGPVATASIDADQACIDSFTITGLSTGNGVVPALCGQNTGQHLYFEIGSEGTDSATLNFNFGATAGSRDYEIRITQYPCNSAYTPPEGCLQWHTGTEGRMSTFNFQANTVHLASQDYNICVRREEGMCCIKYQVCGDASSMTLGTEDAADGQVGSICTRDYIEIENSSAECGAQRFYNRYCGPKLSPFVEVTDVSICDCTAPFRVGVHTDAAADGDVTMKSRGTCLEYSQVPCGGQ